MLVERRSCEALQFGSHNDNFQLFIYVLLVQREMLDLLLLLKILETSRSHQQIDMRRRTLVAAKPVLIFPRIFSARILTKFECMLQFTSKNGKAAAQRLPEFR